MNHQAQSRPYPLVAPSILGGRAACWEDALRQIESCRSVSWVHFDVMDGHFVPNITFGPQLIAELRPQSKLFFDVHLMLEYPEPFLEVFAKAGANALTVHIEAKGFSQKLLKTIQGLGCQAFLALNPETSVDAIKPYLSDLDGVLIMAVNPGFCGQSFDSSAFAKIEQLAQWKRGLGTSFCISVDGGIDEVIGRQCIENGANVIVSGSAFFKSKDRQAFVQSIVKGAVWH